MGRAKQPANTSRNTAPKQPQKPTVMRSEEEIRKKHLNILFGRLKDGEPCSHKGCLNHRSRPCENCNRIGGINEK